MNTIQFLLLQFPHPMPMALSKPRRPRAKVIWFYSLFCSILTWLPRPLPASTTGKLEHSAAEAPKTQHSSLSLSLSLQFFNHPTAITTTTRTREKYCTQFSTLFFPHHDRFNSTFSTYSISFLICIVTYLSLSAIYQTIFTLLRSHFKYKKYLNTMQKYTSFESEVY